MGRRLATFAVVAVAMGILLMGENLAFAGGGTKANATIKVTMQDTGTLAVIVDPPSWTAPPTEQEFLAAGGKLVDQGDSARFRVRAGNHVVGAAIVTSTGVDWENKKTKNVTVAKHKTLKLEFEGGNFK